MEEDDWIPDGMSFSDFSIGTEFLTAKTWRWRVTDIGTRTVIAIRIDEVRVAGGKDGGIVAILDQAEAEAQGWFKGPPYMVAEEVFDEYSFGGCSPVPK